MEGNEKYLHGTNPWTGSSASCILSRKDENDGHYLEELPEDLRNIICVYIFYSACASYMMKELSPNNDDDIFVDGDSEYLDLGYPSVQIKTVAYFGSDRVMATLSKYRDSLSKYKDLCPKEIYETLSSVAKLNIAMDTNREGIIILYKNEDGSSPFPKIEAIN